MRHLAAVFLSLGFLSFLLSSTASAEHDLTCHPPSGPGGGTFTLTFNGQTTAPLRGQAVFQVKVASDGESVFAGRGILKSIDAGKTWVLEGGLATATCSNTDGDRRAGLTLLQFAVRDVLSGQIIPVIVSPLGGDDIDDNGRHEVLILIGSSTYTGWASFYRSF